MCSDGPGPVAEQDIFSLVAFAYTGLGASIGSVLVLRLLNDTISERGALLVALVGGTTVVVWNMLDLARTSTRAFPVSAPPSSSTSATKPSQNCPKPQTLEPEVCACFSAADRTPFAITARATIQSPTPAGRGQARVWAALPSGETSRSDVFTGHPGAVKAVRDAGGNLHPGDRLGRHVWALTTTISAVRSVWSYT